MIELSRYRNVVIILAALGGHFLLLNGLLFLTTGVHPRFLHQGREIDFARFDFLARKTAALQRDMNQEKPVSPPPGEAGSSNRAGRPQSSRRGLIIGQSSSLWGIDLDQLEEQDGTELRWFLISGNGASAAKMAFYARPLMDSSIEFDVVLLALHMAFNAGDIEQPRSARAEIPALYRELVTRRWYDASQRLLDWVWLVKHRQRLGTWVVQQCFETRTRVMHAFGKGADEIFTPVADAWREPLPPEIFQAAPEVAPPLQSPRYPYWSEPERYRSDSVDARALQGLVRHYQQRGARVVLLLMPEKSILRETTPPEAYASLVGPLQSRAGPPVDVIDLRALIEDRLFFDRTHVYAEGRRLLTRRLSEALSSHPSP